MLFTNVFAGLAAIASAAPTLAERQIADNEVKPWELTSVSSARYKSGLHSIKVDLKNPNDYKVQRVPRGYAILPKFNATCEWSWNGASNTPYGAETVCVTQSATSGIYGNITMTLQPGKGTDESTADFTVDIKETRDITIFGLQYIRVWEASSSFLRGDNLNIVCGGTGQCAWSLSPDKKPFFVKQELTKSVGSCEESKVGGC
jgi:hypothetical protein